MPLPSGAKISAETSANGEKPAEGVCPDCSRARIYTLIDIYILYLFIYLSRIKGRGFDVVIGAEVGFSQ